MLRSVGFLAMAAAALGTFGGRSDAAAAAGARRESSPPRETPARPSLPCDFEENLGQTAADVDYLARCSGYVAFLTAGDAVIRTGRDAFRLHVAGGRAARAAASQPRPGLSHYLIGDDRARWTTRVPRFGRVAYDDVLPGVGIRYRTEGRALAFDLTVAAGADPAAVRVRLEGVRWAGPDADGNLSIGLASGASARLSAPRAWQDLGGVRRDVAVAFAQGEARDDFALEVGDHDRSLPLVIDPSLTVSTYLGGTSDDYAYSIAADSSGGIYVAGSAYSSDFPVTTGALQTTKGDPATSVTDAFVMKFDRSGTALAFATYLGGNSSDAALGVAADPSGAVCVGGMTGSTNFPLAGAYQSTAAPGFLTKLGARGDSLAWSTYYAHWTWLLGLDSSGNVHAFNTEGRAFAFDSAGTTLRYSVGVGQTSPPTFAWNSMAVEPSGAVWLGGYVGTNGSASYATAGAYQGSHGGGTYDGWLVKLDAGGAEVYRSYLGGTGDDQIRALGLDASGDLLIAGSTTSPDFPTASPLQPARNGTADAFVVKMDPAASAPTFATYLGGYSFEIPTAVAADADGAVFVAGYTASSDFPTRSAAQPLLGGGVDGFVTELTPGGALSRSTYIGGSGDDAVMSMAVSTSGRPLVVGYTGSRDFPSNCATQPDPSGGVEGFLAGVGTTDLARTTASLLAGATVGQDYSVQLGIDGGVAPLTWTLRSGAMPAGLALSSSGVLSGRPTAAGTASLFVKVVDSGDACAVREYRITVNQRPAIPASSLPAWTRDRPYSAPIPVTGGTAPFTWRHDSGTAPPGTSVTADGLLGGTPTTPGDYSFRVSVTDLRGATASATVTVRINDAPSITTASLHEWTEGRPYADALSASGGTAPLVWSLASGSLPVYGSIDPASGAVGGTTLPHGDYTFAARLQDAAGASAERTVTVHVNAWPAMSPSALPMAVQFRPYSAGPAAAGGTRPLGWTVASGRLQKGFTGLDIETGLLAGTPAEAGRASVVFRLTDAAGAVDDRTYEVVVVPLADVGDGTSRERVTVPTQDAAADLVRCVEALAGTTMDIKLKLRGTTGSAADLLLLDASQTPVDLAAVRTVKPRSIAVRRFVLPATGRWFVVVRPTPTFTGDMSLQIKLRAPASRRGSGTFGDSGAPMRISFSALPGSRVVVGARAARDGDAVPTITSLVDADGDELLVPEEVRPSRRGATLKVRTPLAGGDYAVTLAPTGADAGLVTWSIALASPKGYRFALPDLAITGE